MGTTNSSHWNMSK